MSSGILDALAPGAPFSPSRITGTTRLVGLFGAPVSHSRSPRLHNSCFEAMGLDYAYLAFDVDETGAAQAVKTLRLLNMRGANVTMPIKRAVIPYLDRLTAAAELAGAVNVIVNEGGQLTGHITDGEGFMMSLSEAGVAHEGRHIVILGAGAAAVAVAVQAALDGAGKISIFNRQDHFFEAAKARIAELDQRLDCALSLSDLEDEAALSAAMKTADILINGTPIGMKATVDQTALPNLDLIRPEMVVCDLIYVPEETRLLREAKARGCKTVSGIGMQLYQAAPAFEMWTGQAMDLDVARATLT